MSKTIHIFTDVSGSMNELGKRYIAANLVRYVRDVQHIQPQRFDSFAIRLFACNETVQELSISQDEDIVLPNPSGHLVIEPLISFLEKEKQINVLILTDRPPTQNILARIETISESKFAFVAVGADAKINPNTKKTNLISLGGADISTALEFLLNSSVADVKLPNSLNDIKLPESANENDDDDWS